MPRHARELGETGMYHVMVACADGEMLFRDNEDRFAFLERLHEKRIKFQFRILSYCLVDQAYHLILHEHKSNLSTIMKSLNVSYAAYMHKKYGLIGSIFKDRYKSECLHKMDDLLECIVHVHMQPVEHHLVDVIEQYQWSSYGDFLAEGPSNLIAKDMVFALFSLDDDNARQIFITRHHQEHASFIHHTVTLKKHYSSLIDSREYIHRLLTKYNLQLEQLQEPEFDEIRKQIIHDLRDKTSLSINDIVDELTIKRSQVMQALYHK